MGARFINAAIELAGPDGALGTMGSLLLVSRSVNRPPEMRTTPRESEVRICTV